MPETTPEAPQQNPSRRFVLKAGAHAAWAIPAIQIAAAAPSFAASTDHAQLTLTGSFSRNGSNGTGTFTVKNTGNVAAKSPTVTLSGTGVDLKKGVSAPNWTAATGADSASFVSN